MKKRFAMNTATLRGIFPDPKPVHTKNFIKENMKHIKKMQGLLQEAGMLQKKPARMSKEKQPMKTVSHNDAIKSDKLKANSNISKRVSQTGSLPGTKTKATGSKANSQSNKKSISGSKPKLIGEKQLLDEKIIEMGVQTETNNDIEKICEEGTIMYPSASVLKEIQSRKAMMKQKKFPKLRRSIEETTEQMQNLNMGDKKNKSELNADPYKVPETYQKGVIPKYLRQRKEEQLAKESEGDTECPPGHILLPEEERKETLRVLRESYAERIQELNSMPVRNDTLKMRKRKIAIEEELKKIDEGIKVFQRPKVFVKVNA